MHLQQFELRGFKSFAEPVSFHFTRGITAIVGPNGSGKSNISDAIRWVLGEQSMKLLRGKKSDDVIFSGSDRKSRLGMAEVTMTINNEDGRMPVDFREVAITRRVYRSGEGEYLLNKKPAKLHDMLLLFAKSRFGQKSYSVIGQGMIDHVLASTPAERKAFFDEAAGVRQYQMKREQALRRLDETRKNLAQAELLMAEIEPRLRSLTRQVRRLERRGELEQQLHDVQQDYYTGKYWVIFENERELTGRRKAQEATVEKIKSQLKETQAALEKLEHEQGREERFETLQQEYTEVLEQKNRLLRESAELKGRLDADAIGRGDLPVVWLQKRKEELEKDIARYREQEERTQKQRMKTVKEQEISERDLQEATRAIGKLSERLAALKEKIERREKPQVLLHALQKIQSDHGAFLQELKSRDSLERLKNLVPDAERLHRSMEKLAGQLANYQQVEPRELLRLHEEIQEMSVRRSEIAQQLIVREKEVLHLKDQEQMRHGFLEGLQEELDRITSELKRSAPTATAEGAAEEAARELKTIEGRIEETNTRLSAIRRAIGEFNAREEGKREELFRLQKRFRDEQQKLNDASQQLNGVRVELAKTQAHREDLEREVNAELPEERAKAVLAAQAPKRVDEAHAESTIEKLKHQLELIGGIDEGVQEEYTETNERFSQLQEQVEDLQTSLVNLEKAIADLDATIKREFARAFEKINREFNKYFKALFEGGRAELVLMKEEPRPDPADAEEGEASATDTSEVEGGEAVSGRAKQKVEKVITGVDIRAVPPGKRVSTINMLSGGERALTSIALVSAIIATNPSPFVFLDEVDAALDEANSQRFARILKDLAKKTQFITVTHNRATMEMAEILYGVTMGADGVSKVLSVKMEDVDKVIESQGNRR